MNEMDNKKVNRKKRKVIFLLLLSLMSIATYAQKASLKTNLLYGATTTPNLAFEIGLSDKTSVELSVGYNPWEFADNKKLKHYLIQPEFRWWFCETFNGLFLGAHLLGGEYNMAKIKLPFGIYKSLQDYRYEGYFYGGGISLGNQWLLNSRWSIEAYIGLGYVRTHFDKYPCEECGKRIKSDDRNYFGPTKAGISLIYYLW